MSKFIKIKGKTVGIYEKQYWRDSMIRKFLPVGQGAFYYEHFGECETSTGKVINVVYDCGSSTDVKIVEQQIERNFSRKEKINALVISHLHEDHINGIPYLLRYCNVEKVYFPQIASENKELMKLYLKINKVDETAYRFLTELLELGELGEEWEGIEDLPQFIPVPEYPEESEQARIDVAGKIKFPDSRIEWEYIPFNFRNEQRIQIVKEELEKEGISLSDISNMDDEFFEQNKEKWKEIYKKVPGDFNTNSMTLFSGACDSRVVKYIACTEEDEYFERYWNQNLYCRCYYFKACCHKKPDSEYYSGWDDFGCLHKKSGCLFMGDYDASGKNKWKRLQEAYRSYWKYIGCVQVAHHGSTHNFNEKLLNINAEFVISAGIKNKYHHPHPSVVKKLVLHEKWPWIVTEDQESMLKLKIYYLDN